MRRLAVLCLALAILVPVARVVHAGEIFVTVGVPTNRFSPQNAFFRDVGDVVVWNTFTASMHTVTQGTTGNETSWAFNTNPLGGTAFAGSFFSWKTDRTSVSYYCKPHFAFSMTGTAQMVGSIVLEADFRINEVRYDGVANFIEITNLGDAAGDLNGFRLSINGSTTIRPWVTATNVAPGGMVVVNDPAGLTTSGSVALYAPNTIPGAVGSSIALTDATMMIDYVEWGTAGGQPLEATAAATVLPTVWTAGDFAPQVATTHDINFCGTRFQYGVNFWTPVDTPSPGAVNNCLSPARQQTWGRLKTLYR